MFAIDINTGMTITVKPVAIYQSDAYDTLLIADAITGKGIWLDSNSEWNIDLEDDDFDYVAEKVEGIYGKNKEEWEAAANAKLAKYGLRLGGFCKTLGDRYKLVEA